MAAGQSVCDLLHTVIDQIHWRIDGHPIFESKGSEVGVISEASGIADDLIVNSVKEEISLSEYLSPIIVDVVVIGYMSCGYFSMVTVGDNEEAILLDLPDIGHAC